MLEIKNLQVAVDNNKQILRGINLSIKPGEIHAIMGPNGSGKSTLAAVLAGKEGYNLTGGTVEFLGQDLLALTPEQRAAAGVFLAFQYPVEIPGVSNINFLKTAINQIRKQNSEPPLDSVEFLKLMQEKRQLMEIDDKLISRSVNEGFSGGEKKRNEIFQLLMLNPKLAILDETDSGLDIDSLKVVADGINRFMNNEKTVIIVTHYQRLLDFITPNYVHVLYNGKIVKSGSHLLAKEIEEKGYSWIKEQSK